MPSNEPGPDFGTPAQPAPKVWAPASVPMLEPMLAPLLALSAGLAVELLSLLPHAARPRVAPSAIAANPVRRIMVFICCPFEPLRVECGHLAFGAAARADCSCVQEMSKVCPSLGQETETTSFWMPEAPSGNGVVRAGVWTRPERSIARQESWCGPGSASQRRYHWRQ